jgi:CubicO group peptidase (beta-lactamase class C family)
MATTLRYGKPEEAGMDPRRIEHVKGLARGWVEEGVTPSLVVLAARRGVIVLHEAYGVMGPEPDAGPLQKDTIFPIASISKPITAAAVMCLVEDGLLGLNRPVQWYIPEFVGEGKDAVMVHHLLTHTAGFTDEGMSAHVQSKRGTRQVPPPESTEHPWLHEEYCLRYDAPLSWLPGKEMSYYSWNYEFLGEIVRRASGRAFADFVQQRILGPLGMADTHWTITDDLRDRVVRRDQDDWGAETFAAFRILETPWASAGACSTARDMAVFAQMFLNLGTYGDVRILSRPAVTAMTRNQIPGISTDYFGDIYPEATWGLGWSLCGSKKSVGYAEVLQSPASFCHGGFGGTLLWADPEAEIVGACFSVNRNAGVPAHHRGRTIGELYGRPDLFINAVTASIVD